VEVKLFALGYHEPHNVDTLQLVDYSLCIIVETHRRHHFTRHRLEVIYDPASLRPLRFGNITSAAMRDEVHGCQNAFPLDDSATLELVLDSNRVSCLYRLAFHGDLPAGGEELLATRLISEGIPVQVVEIRQSPDPLPALNW